jgi:hypothetical protein
MEVEASSIKVKDTSIYLLVFVGCLLCPFLICFIYLLLDLSALWFAIISLIIFSLFFLLLILYLKKSQNYYVLTADSTKIIIFNKREIVWEQVTSINTFSRADTRGAMPRKYLRIALKSGEMIDLNASNFDVWYEDLRDQLNSIKEELK